MLDVGSFIFFTIVPSMSLNQKRKIKQKKTNQVCTNVYNFWYPAIVIQSLQHAQHRNKINVESHLYKFFNSHPLQRFSLPSRSKSFEGGDIFPFFLTCPNSIFELLKLNSAYQIVAHLF